MALSDSAPILLRSSESTSATLRLNQVSDTHISDEAGSGNRLSFQRVLRAALASSPDALLLSGDLANDAEPGAYAWLAEQLAEAACPVIVLPGNHDHPSRMREHLVANNIHQPEAVQLGAWQVWCLNSVVAGAPHGEVGPEQIAWLRERAEKAVDSPVLLVVHHHPLPIGSPWMDAMGIRNAPELLGVVSEIPAIRAVTCGHVHQARSLQSGGHRVFTSPSTCDQFQPNSERYGVDFRSPGYRWFELAGNGGLRTGVTRIDSTTASRSPC